MASARPKGTDFGAALSGLVLGGSVIFLVVLTIVWLTNAHFAELKASGAHGTPAPAPPAAAPAAQTTPGTPQTTPAAGH